MSGQALPARPGPLERLTSAVRARRVSAEELTRRSLDRIERSKDLVAVVLVDAERAITRAREQVIIYSSFDPAELRADDTKHAGIKHLRTAVQLKPKDDSVRFNLGAGLLAVGQTDAAIREFQTAITLNPENADAHFNLGVILGPRNQLDVAIRHLQRAVEINPLNADAYHNLAVAYGLQGRIDAAIVAAQTAVRLKPAFAAAQEQLRRLLAARNR